MQETSEIQEGFLCPLCMKDFQNPQLLQNHFVDEHSSEDSSSKGQNAQGIFDRAKRKLLRKDSEFERNEEFQGSSFTSNVSFSYWEPQELGIGKSKKFNAVACRDNASLSHLNITN